MAEGRGTTPQWIETGVPQLDRVLGGGLLRGSLAMVIGAPGAGKTVMAQQIAFHAAAQERATLFLTGYSETHDKLLSHSRGLTFFQPDRVGDKIQFANLLDVRQPAVRAARRPSQGHRADAIECERQGAFQWMVSGGVVVGGPIHPQQSEVRE